MRYIGYLFFSMVFAQSVYAHNFVDALDVIISQKTSVLARDFRDIKKTVSKITSRIKEDVTFQDMQDFLNFDTSVVKIFIEKMHLKNNSLSPEAWQQAQDEFRALKEAIGAKLYIYYLECCKQKMLYKAVQNYNAINFWKSEQFAERLPFYQKAASRWFARQSYKNKIVDNLTHLQEIERQIHGFLGLVRYNENLLFQAQSYEGFFEQLRIAAHGQHEFLYHMKRDMYNNADIETLLKMSLAQVDQFTQDLAFHYAHCQLPSHFERHWQAYTTMAVLLAASGFTYQKYGTDIAQALHNFYYTHIQGPLNRSKETFLKGAVGPQLDTTEHRKDLAAMRKEFLKLPEPRTEGNPTLALINDLDRLSDGAASKLGEELDGVVILNPLTWKGDMMTTKLGKQWRRLFDKKVDTEHGNKSASPASDQFAWIDKLSLEEQAKLVAERSHTIKKHNTLNVLDTINARSIEFEMKMLEVQEVANAFLKDAYVILGLATLIPAVVLIGGSLFTSRKIYDSVAYQPIRTFVRQLEVALNACIDACGSFERDGKLYFITEQLRLHVPVLTLQEQKLMYSDIEELQSSHLNYQQKFNIIERMYRTYPCLTIATRVG